MTRMNPPRKKVKDPVMVQADRRESSRDLIWSLTGGRDLVMIDGDLVDRSSGEILEAPPGAGKALRYAWLLKLSEAPENQWKGKMIRQEGQDAVPQAGSLWKSSLRIDPEAMKAMRARTAAKARKDIAWVTSYADPGTRELVRKGKLRWRMVTLTQDDRPGASSEQEIRRLNRAWELFRKREVWAGRVEAGIKAIEDALDSQGPHAHIHALVLSKYMPRDAKDCRDGEYDLRREWTACVRQAAKDEDLEDIRTMPDGLLNVDVAMVGGKRAVARAAAKGETALTKDDAVFELTKYVTTPEALSGLSAQTLIDLCNVERWPRMFETLGLCRAHSEASKALEAWLQASVQTSCIFDGEEWVPLDPMIAEYYEHMESEARTVIERVDHSTGTGDRSEVHDEVIAMESRPLIGGTANSWQFHGPLPREEIRERGPTWREKMETQDLTTWCRGMALAAERAQAYRWNWLKKNLVSFDAITLDRCMNAPKLNHG